MLKQSLRKDRITYEGMIIRLIVTSNYNNRCQTAIEWYLQSAKEITFIIAALASKECENKIITFSGRKSKSCVSENRNLNPEGMLRWFDWGFLPIF